MCTALSILRRHGILLPTLLLGAAPALVAQRFEDYAKRTSDVESGDRVGTSLAISGNVFVAGVPTADDNGFTSGALYVFRRSAVNGLWIEEAKLAPTSGPVHQELGESVSIDGEVIAASSSSGLGAVYVYRYDPGLETWDLEQRLAAPDAVPGDFFGSSVAVSGDVLAIGSEFDSSNSPTSGSVYIYEYDSGSGQWVPRSELYAPDPHQGDRFGNSVDLQGDALLVGALGHDGQGVLSGKAYVYRDPSGTGNFGLEDELQPGDLSGGEQFGSSVDLDADLAVFGCQYADLNGSDSGTVYVYRYDSVGMSWVPEDKLEPAEVDGGDLFGHAVAVSASKGIVLAGAPVDEIYGLFGGAVYVFGYQPGSETWELKEIATTSEHGPFDQLGSATAIEGDQAVLGAWREESVVLDGGAVYVITDADLRLTVSPDPLIVGQNGTFTVKGGAPDAPAQIFFSLQGLGLTPDLSWLVFFNLQNAKSKPFLNLTTNASGNAQLVRTVPNKVRNRTIWLQAAQLGRKTNVVEVFAQ